MTDTAQKDERRISTLDVLVSVGFSHSHTDPPLSGVTFDFGNFKLSALACKNRLFVDVVLLTGNLWLDRGTLVEIVEEIPPFVESRQEALAYVVSALDRACRPKQFAPALPTPWVDEGRANKLLVPWERLRAESVARQAEYAASPRCSVERDWMKVGLKTLERRLRDVHPQAVVAVMFDGEEFTFRCEDLFCVMPATGNAWTVPVHVAADSLRNRPKRLRPYVEVLVWRDNLNIGGNEYPILASVAKNGVAG